MSPAAARTARSRKRRANGRRVIGVEIKFCEVSEKLIEAGLLDWQDAESRAAVGIALGKAIHVWCNADEVTAD